MESSDSNESDRDEEQMSQNTNSNSVSVIVAGPTGVTGPHVIKFVHAYLGRSHVNERAIIYYVFQF